MADKALWNFLKNLMNFSRNLRTSQGK